MSAADLDDVVVDEAATTLRFVAMPVDVTGIYDLGGLDDLVVTRESCHRIARLRDALTADFEDEVEAQLGGAVAYCSAKEAV